MYGCPGSRMAYVLKLGEGEGTVTHASPYFNVTGGVLMVYAIVRCVCGTVGNNGPNIDFPKHDPFRR